MTMVFEVDKPAGADACVQVVDSPAVADLLVYKDEGKVSSLHNEGVWYFVGDRAPSAKKIHFTKKPGYKNLKVCFVPSKGLSGWLKHHQLKGRL